VVAVAGLGDLLEFAGERVELVRHRDALLAYRARYGIA
jgi:orotate phosphoribosyltransferase